MTPQSEKKVRDEGVYYLSLSNNSYLVSFAVVSTTGSLVFLGLNPGDCGNNGNKTDQIELRSHDPPPGQSGTECD